MAAGERKSYEYEDLDSEFDSAEKDRTSLTWRDDPLSHDKLVSHSSQHSGTLPSKQVLVDERDKEEWRSRRFHFLSMDAYSRHKTLINRYLLAVGRGIEHITRPTDKDKNDYDILKEHHRFLWDSSDTPNTWENRLAKAYYDKLIKEYAISDLSQYKQNKIALRWQTEKEVVEGKGQFICGNKICKERVNLTSWEVNFGYTEQGEKRNALVKLRLCPECSTKLNYHHQKRVRRRREKRKKEGKKKSRKHKKRKEEFSPSDNSDSSPNSGKEKLTNTSIIRYDVILLLVYK